MSSFIAAGTSYTNYGLPTIPFYIYYSMFGYQRVGDLMWAAADSRAGGFLVGATAGRTTLSGEGLQHEDGHSHVLFSVVPIPQSPCCFGANFCATVLWRQRGRRGWLSEYRRGGGGYETSCWMGPNRFLLANSSPLIGACDWREETARSSAVLRAMSWRPWEWYSLPSLRTV